MKKPLKTFLERLILKGSKLLNRFIKFYEKTEFTRKLFIKARTSRMVGSSRIVEYNWVLKHLGNVRKILDVGSTTSLFPVQLASIGYDVYSIDPRNYVEWHGIIHPNMKFVKGDITQCPFTEFFDAVTAISTIEHIGTKDFYRNPLIGETKDLEALREIARILKEKGKFVFTLPYRRKQPQLEHKVPFIRLYNEETIRTRLLKDLFDIETEQYFCRQNGFWHHASMEEMENFGGKDALVCIVARKTKERQI
jgi:SAM-dependent methyltransferase